MPSITITGSDPATGNLTMSDNGSTNANRGQIVTWIIGPRSGVKSIDKIHWKNNSIDVFSPDPHKVGNGNAGNWQGKISDSISIPSEEIYYINWTDDADNTHRYDPKIIVNQ